MGEVSSELWGAEGMGSEASPSVREGLPSPAVREGLPSPAGLNVREQ